MVRVTGVGLLTASDDLRRPRVSADARGDFPMARTDKAMSLGETFMLVVFNCIVVGASR